MAKSKKEAVQYAATEDTATLEHPDSKRDQRAIIQAAPPSIAFKEVQTPSAHVLESEDGGTVRAFAKSTTNENNVEVTEVECPDGHSAGKGEAAHGTVGKTATCSECGKLLVPTHLINDATGEEIQFVKKGDRRLVKSTKKSRGEAEKAAATKTPKKTARKATKATKKTTSKSKAKSETAAA